MGRLAGGMQGENWVLLIPVFAIRGRRRIGRGSEAPNNFRKLLFLPPLPPLFQGRLCVPPSLFLSSFYEHLFASGRRLCKKILPYTFIAAPRPWPPCKFERHAPEIKKSGARKKRGECTRGVFFLAFAFVLSLRGGPWVQDMRFTTHSDSASQPVNQIYIYSAIIASP